VATVATIDDVNSASTTIVMNSDKTVTANFVKKYTLTTSVYPGNICGRITRKVGTVINNGPYNYNTVVTLTAIPKSGYRFVNWTGDVAAPNSVSTSVTMNATKSVTANFEVCSEYDCYGVSSSSDYDAGNNKTTFTYAVWEKLSGSNRKDISHFKLNFGDKSWKDNVSMNVDEGTGSYKKEVKKNEIKMDNLVHGFKKGTITITFTGCVEAETGLMTIKAGNDESDFDVCKPIINDDATLSDLTVNGTTITGFSSSTYTYDVELPSGTTDVPTVGATLNDANASMVVTPAADVTGTATVVVTAEDGSTKLTYEVIFPRI